MIYSTDLILQEIGPEEFPHTSEVLQSGIQDRVASGIAAGFWDVSRPDRIFMKGLGTTRYSSPSLSVNPETTFDLASISKVFCTAALAAVLVERGWIHWDTQVAAILPGFRYPEIKIRHLLAHTAGYIAWTPFWEKIRDHFSPVPVYKIDVKKRQSLMRDLVLRVQPEIPVDQRALYSDVSFLVLGFALEEVTSMPLDQAVRKFVWQPMGILGAFYRRVTHAPVGSELKTVAATEESAWRGGVLQGQVHDDNCWAMGGYAGHAGAFGTARDVLHFSRSLLTGFLSKKVLNELWTRVSAPPGCERTLGWDTPSGQSSSAGKWFSPHTVGHLGYTGTSLWIDREAGLAVTLLTNRVHPSSENWAIKQFRPKFHDAIRLDLQFKLRKN